VATSCSPAAAATPCPTAGWAAVSLLGSEGHMSLLSSWQQLDGLRRPPDSFNLCLAWCSGCLQRCKAQRSPPGHRRCAENADGCCMSCRRWLVQHHAAEQLRPRRRLQQEHHHPPGPWRGEEALILITIEHPAPSGCKTAIALGFAACSLLHSRSAACTGLLVIRNAIGKRPAQLIYLLCSCRIIIGPSLHLQTVEIEEVTRDGDVHSVKTTHRIGDKVRHYTPSRPASKLQRSRCQEVVQARGARWVKGSLPLPE
jgi:hypothetical protein